METYYPDPTTSIIHYVTVDFTKRFVETPVHLVQYDNSLPILSITLLQSGNVFLLSEDAIALLKYGKYDRNFVVLDALGVSSDGGTVYFEVPYQVTVESGTHQPIIEVWIDGKVASSSSFTMVIDKNPVQNSQIESQTDYKSLRKFRDEAEEYGTLAKSSADEVLAHIDEAAASAEAAAASAASVAGAEQIAVDAANRAAASATEAAASETRSEEILDSMEQMVEGGLFYLEVNSLPAVGQNNRTIYLVPSSTTVQDGYREAWIDTTGEGDWKCLGDIGLTYLEVDALPTRGANNRTIYLVPSNSPSVPTNYKEAWIDTSANGDWKCIGTAKQGDVLFDTDVTIAVEDWNTTTNTATKTIKGVSTTNKVYVFSEETNQSVYCTGQAVNQLIFGLREGYTELPTGPVHFSIQVINPVVES